MFKKILLDGKKKNKDFKSQGNEDNSEIIEKTSSGEVIDKPTEVDADESEEKIDSHDEKIKNFKYLDELIHSGVKVVVLDSDIVLGADEESRYSYGIELDVDDLIIEGNDHKIDALNRSGIFRIIGDNVQLRNIVFKNANAENGSAIYNFGNSLSCINCIFNSNSSDGKGGAVFNDSKSLKVEGCTFVSNSASCGDAIYNYNASLLCIDCSFNDNQEGGTIFSNENSSLTVDGCGFDIHSRIKSNSINIVSEVKSNYPFWLEEGCTINYISNSKQGEDLNIEPKSNIDDNSKDLYNMIEFDEKIITFNSDVLCDSEEFKEGMLIDEDDTVIDGNNFTIDACGKTRMFRIAAKNITIKNLFFKNGSSNRGGAIYLGENASLTIKNCHFEGNNAVSGGVIYNSSNLLNSLDNCTFIENSSKGSGGVVHCQRGSSFDFNGCDFSKNSSRKEGAVIFNEEGDLKFTDCNFNNNYSSKSGGSIYNKGIISLIDCNFEDNCAIEDAGDIYNLNMVNIHNSNFVNNEYNRNLIFQADDEDNTLSIIGSSFISSNNILYIEDGFVHVDNTKFNVVEDKYGLFSKKAILSIIKSKLNAKKGIFCDNIIELEEKSEFEKQIVFGDNFKSIRYLHSDYPIDYKGFEYLDELVSSNSSEIKLEYDIKIHDAEKNFYEGGVELDRNLIIDGNGHIIDGNGLSRVFIITSGNITLKNIIFKNGKHFKNHLLDDLGGGAILASPLSILTIKDCQFLGNESRQNAGAIYNKSQDLKISNSKFANNSSRDSGGAILTYGSLILNKCDFSSNSSKWGGAICNNHFLESEDSCFKDNCSEVGAGAIYNQKGNFKLKNSSFEANHSRRGEGGAIYNDKDAFMELFDCKFMENYSKFVDAGAIYNIGDLNCIACCFDLNKSCHQGGAIGNGGSFNLINCNFKENSALYGGAIYNKWNLFKCRDCSFDDDSAEHNGNELYIVQNGSLELNNCKFKNLDVYQDYETGPLTIVDCSFKKGGNIRSFGHIMIFENEKGKYEDILDGECHIYYV